MNATKLNTHGVALGGLAIGGSAIIASVYGLFKLLKDPNYLVTLYWALSHIRHHVATQADTLPLAQLVAACFGILGAIIIAFLMCYFGKPSNIKDSAPIDGAGVPPADVSAKQ